jgi:hypothetical protein
MLGYKSSLSVGVWVRIKVLIQCFFIKVFIIHFAKGIGMYWPSLRLLGILIGSSLIISGIAGYFPIFTGDDGLFLFFFEVNRWHTTAHLIAGIITVLFSLKYAKLYFRVVGTIIVFITIVFWNKVFPPSPLNLADKLMHLSLGILLLYLGFFYKPTNRQRKLP